MISIIIPMYNVGNKIIRTIDSIMNQNIEDLELVIVDDFSLDDSYRICENYLKEKQFKNYILVKNEKNRGPSYTRNRAISLAKRKILYDD